MYFWNILTTFSGHACEFFHPSTCNRWHCLTVWKFIGISSQEWDGDQETFVEWSWISYFFWIFMGTHWHLRLKMKRKRMKLIRKNIMSVWVVSEKCVFGRACRYWGRSSTYFSFPVKCKIGCSTDKNIYFIPKNILNIIKAAMESSCVTINKMILFLSFLCLNWPRHLLLK